MSSIAPAANTVDWLSGAWSTIQSTSGTGIAILDALSSSNTSAIGAGLNDSVFNALSNTLTSVAQNFVQQQNLIFAQEAVTRVQNQAAAALQKAQSQVTSSTGTIVNKTS